MQTQHRQFLLNLARHTLEYYFETGKKLQVDSKTIDSELKSQQGTFVTLHEHGDLRGCIGHIEPVQEIYRDVIENALSSAFDDPRFMPLRVEELDDIIIEISILSVPEKFNYTSVGDLVTQLETTKSGLIIEKGSKSATYLPQVWDEITDVEDFLSSLCVKAGLSAREWQTGDLTVYTYSAEVFGE